ncbi:hypothetical protein CEXT_760811 [Caerostris extrusa]|uniref:Uncharacterized protein n=1 Tax=Caerostris extrusa TaxID=172846 RepID=A0AAV4NBP6_CAEEX|nr:hypothetical protein CEXT_760811 [Caerostris extrusa]
MALFAARPLKGQGGPKNPHSNQGSAAMNRPLLSNSAPRSPNRIQMRYVDAVGLGRGIHSSLMVGSTACGIVKALPLDNAKGCSFIPFF